MQNTVNNVPAGTIVKHSTGYFTVLGYKKGFYSCKNTCNNPEYSQALLGVREEDINFFLKYYKNKQL